MWDLGFEYFGGEHMRDCLWRCRSGRTSPLHMPAHPNTDGWTINLWQSLRATNPSRSVRGSRHTLLTPNPNPTSNPNSTWHTLVTPNPNPNPSTWHTLVTPNPNPNPNPSTWHRLVTPKYWLLQAGHTGLVSLDPTSKRECCV